MLQNLLYNQLSTQSGIVAILEFDPTIFDDLVFPEGVDKQIFVDALVQSCGHTPLLHPDPGYLHYYIPAWGKRTYKIWEKLAATLDLEYNPIENYDRNSTYTVPQVALRSRMAPMTVAVATQIPVRTRCQPTTLQSINQIAPVRHLVPHQIS